MRWPWRLASLALIAAGVALTGADVRCWLATGPHGRHAVETQPWLPLAVVAIAGIALLAGAAYVVAAWARARRRR